MSLTNLVKESSLSRLWTHNEKHDCGAVTAFLVARNCGKGMPYTKKEKLQRNKKLRSSIRISGSGYEITTIYGVSKEGKIVTKEVGYFLVDRQDTGNLYRDLKKWGEEFKQYSILFVPVGAIAGKDKAVLCGTNHCANNELGFHKEQFYNKGVLGKSNPIYTSYVNGRPFIFETIGDILYPVSGFAWWAIESWAKTKWEAINVDAELNE